jgi:2-(1,2-epoxy-1,2-dihydrophenyl)acetyl-CoA isomerase
MTPSPASSLLFDLDASTGVATLTLNRPERLNAFDLPMIDAWRAALARVEADRAVRALIVTGAGRAFCAGGDMDELRSFMSMNALERKDFLWRNVHQIGLLLERIDCPVIAAINGTARGAGLDMALMCDLRVLDGDAQIAESYISMGLMPGDGGAWFLPRLVGVSRALDLLWSGDPVDAQTALRIGLVDRVAPPGEALASARALAERLARQPQEAVRFIKRAVRDSMAGATSLRAHFDAVSSHMSVLEDLPAFRERVAAFERRQRGRD